MQKTINCQNSPSLFQLGYALSRVEINDISEGLFKLPCLALMVLFIFLSSNDNVPRRVVIDSLSRQTGIDSSSEGRGFGYIPEILSAISSYDNRFDNNIRGTRQNVGRLQYQRVLKQNELSLFNDFIYCNNVSFDGTVFTSYEDLMNYSLLSKLTGRYAILRDRIVSRNRFIHKDFFLRQIRFFDREKYELSTTRSLPKVNGSFFLLINCQRNTFTVFTDIRIDQDIRTDFGMILSSLEESEDGYYSTCINVSSLDDYSRLFYEDDNIKITTNNSSRYLCFQETQGYLFQVYDLQPGHRYYIVCQRREIQRLQSTQSLVQLSIPAFFLNNGWMLFRIDSWQADNPKTIVKSPSLIVTGTGVSVPGEKDTFFADGLPEIYPDTISVLLEKNIVERGNHTISRVVRRQNGAIYVDIKPLPELPDGVSVLPVRVIDSTGGRQLIDSYNVEFPLNDILEKKDFQMYFSSDGWGRICINRENEPQLFDNQLRIGDTHFFNSKCTNKKRYVQTTRDYSGRYIRLLRALYNKKGYLSKTDIYEVTNYLSGYYGLEQSDIQNKGLEYNYLIKVLVDLGFVNRSYDDNSRTIYQVASPRLFPIKRMNGCTEYLLYGSYSSTQLQSLQNRTASFFYVEPYSYELEKQHPSLVFIPYYVVLTLQDEQLNSVERIGITVEDASLADRILSFVKLPSSFESDFMTESNRRLNQYDSTVNYPRVIGSRRDCQLENGPDIYNSYLPDNHRYRRVHIPYDLMLQYCLYRHDRPVLYSGNDTIGFVYGMALPSLYKKCLAFINVGLPTRQYTFSLSGLLGDHLLYSFIEYNIPNEMHPLIASKLSGSNAPDRMIKYEVVNSLRYKMYYIEQSSFEPFTIQVVFNQMISTVHAYARKIGDAYVVFKRVGDAYYKLNYSSAREALAAIVNDASELNAHIDYTSCDTKGQIAVNKNLQIIKIIK